MNYNYNNNKSTQRMQHPWNSKGYDNGWLWLHCDALGRRIDQIKSVLHSSPHALSYDTLLNMDSSNLFYKVNFDLKC